MANHFLRFRLSKKEWIITAAAVTIIIFTISQTSKTPDSSLDSDANKAPATVSDLSDLIAFTPLTNAHRKDAFCLDGSVPGYHLSQGFGSGSRNWLLHIEGGGWCNTEASCSYRKQTALGSSNYMDHEVQFSGILSRDPLQNPDFFNWNKVKIRYCDGASFSGHPESELKGDKVKRKEKSLSLFCVRICRRMERSSFSEDRLSGMHLWLIFCQSDFLLLGRHFSLDARLVVWQLSSTATIFEMFYPGRPLSNVLRMLVSF